MISYMKMIYIKCRSMLMLRIDLYFFAQKEKYYA